tara:strand:+ start:410 stop:559 length:150 start_codon:yes stop_codon:yes gene_type:complete
MKSEEIKQARQTLADDLGITNTRPGCLEAANMQQVIDSHGWEIHLGNPT